MLELLAKNHKMWLKMLIDMGCSVYVAEDIVQSMYLRLHKYVKDEKKIMKELVLNEMENAVKLEVPLLVEAEFGKNWLDAH